MFPLNFFKRTLCAPNEKERRVSLIAVSETVALPAAFCQPTATPLSREGGFGGDGSAYEVFAYDKAVVEKQPDRVAMGGSGETCGENQKGSA